MNCKALKAPPRRDGNEGFIIPARDVSAIMGKVSILHRDSELRLRMGERARRRAEEFTWDAYQRKVGEIVGDLVRA